MDPLTAMMLSSMAVDYISKPIDRARSRRDLRRDIEAAKTRLLKEEDTITSNPYVNTIRNRENERIERKALDIEAGKEL